jgi:protein-tyrosine kinase
MEHIKQAIDRAKESHAAPLQPQPGSTGQQQPNVSQAPGNAVMLNTAHLESKRVIAHDIADPRSKSFDMLRTQVLQSMDMKSWQIIGVTSPTAGCGKSVISVNLALSIARQQERAVLLVDMDLQKPRIAENLGLSCDQGMLSVLEGRTKLSNALIPVRVRNERLVVLPCEEPILNSSEWMSSRSMATIMQDIKRDLKAWTVIVDLPPILPSDDVISILPQIDCALFVVQAGTTTAPEIRECNRHLETTPVVRVVLNKASDATAKYYSYAGYGDKKAPRAALAASQGSNPAGFKRPQRSALKSVTQLIDRIARI